MTSSKSCNFSSKFSKVLAQNNCVMRKIASDKLKNVSWQSRNALAKEELKDQEKENHSPTAERKDARRMSVARRWESLSAKKSGQKAKMLKDGLAVKKLVRELRPFACEVQRSPFQ